MSDDVFEKLEERAGHKLTMVLGPLGGVSTYYCETCGALVQTRASDLVLFHVPQGSWSSEAACKPAGGAVGNNQRSLKDKLKALAEADYERLKAI